MRHDLSTPFPVRAQDHRDQYKLKTFYVHAISFYEDNDTMFYKMTLQKEYVDSACIWIKSCECELIFPDE